MSLKYRGFKAYALWIFLAHCTYAPHVTNLHLFMMRTLEINITKHNARHLSVDQHTSICQYRPTVTTHQLQNAGENKRELYVHGLPAVSLKTRFNTTFFAFLPNYNWWEVSLQKFVFLSYSLHPCYIPSPLQFILNTLTILAEQYRLTVKHFIYFLFFNQFHLLCLNLFKSCFKESSYN
jgi:hypothetical protein